MPTRITTWSSEESVTIPLSDRLFIGEGLFETIKVTDKTAEFPELHWQRLHNSAKLLGIPFSVSVDEWTRSLAQYIEDAELIQGGIKAILTGGEASRGLAEQGNDTTLIFQSFTYQALSHPVKLISSPWGRDAKNPLYHVKSINYLEAILAKRLALQSGAEDALFFNLSQHAMETCTANVFFILNGELLTPPLADGVLPGITRARIINYCEKNQLVCHERSLSLAMIKQSEALFCCNSLQGIRVISSLDDTKFNESHPLIERLIQVI
jgi:4-amino-4-deoxychorismate lyase